MNFSSSSSHRSALRSRSLIALTLAFTVSAVGFGAMTPFLVLWGRHDAHLPGATVGLLFVVQAVGEITGGLAGGMLADRLGGRRILAASSLAMALAYGALALVTAPAPALTVMFVAGLAEAAFHPTAFALVSDLVPAPERTTAFGVLRTGGSLGAILGPLAGALIAAHAPLAVIFGFSAAALAATGVLVLGGLPRRRVAVDLHEEAEELRDAVPGLAAIARDRRLALLVAAGGLLAVTLAWWEADGLVVLRAARPLHPSAFSLLLALGAAITVVGQLPVTRLIGDRAPAGPLAVGATLQAAGLGTLALAPLGLGFVVAGVVLVTLGQMAYGPRLSALVAEIAPAGRTATYQAAISTTADLGMALGPVSGLALAGLAGPGAVWAVALGLGLLGATVATAAARRASARSAVGEGAATAIAR